MEVKLYNGEITILFDDSLDKNGKPKHAYYLLKKGKKKRLRGVTTYINILDKPGLVNWAVNTTIEYLKGRTEDLILSPMEILNRAKQEAERQKQKAADIGTAVHNWIERYIREKVMPPMPEDERAIVGVTNFLDWVKRCKVKFLETEKIVYSRRYDYVGRLDAKIAVGDKLYLMDVKTSNAIYEGAYMQTAAYLMADEEESNDEYEGRVILRLAKETEEEFRNKPKNKDREYKIFEDIWLDRGEEDFQAFLSCISLYNWKNKLKKYV